MTKVNKIALGDGNISAEVLKRGAEAKRNWLESGQKKDKGQEAAVYCLAGAAGVKFHVQGIGAFSILNFNGYKDMKTGDKKAVIDTILKLFFAATDYELEDNMIRDRLKTPLLQIWEVVAYVLINGGQFSSHPKTNKLILFPASLAISDPKTAKDPKTRKALEDKRLEKENSECTIGGANADISFEKLKGIAGASGRGTPDTNKKISDAFNLVVKVLSEGDAVIQSHMIQSAFIFARLEGFAFPPEVLKAQKAKAIAIENKIEAEAEEPAIAA